VSASSTRSAVSVAAEPRRSSTPSRDPQQKPRTGFRRVLRAPLVIGLAAAVVVIDQLSKQWALSRLSEPDDLVELVGSLQLRLTFNTGTAFSLGDDLQLGPFIAVLALAVVGWLLWSGHSDTKAGAVAAGLVAGGAIGNLLDRAFRSGPWGGEAGFMGGAVVDFIDLQWWPVFNVADAAIVIGAILLVLVSMRAPADAEA
jgi:signal peptidase II